MRPALLGLLIVVGGCSTPGPDRVWVDRAEFALTTNATSIAMPPGPSLTGGGRTIEAVPRRVVADPAAEDTVSLDESVRFSQERAARVLAQRLRRLYESETRRMALELERDRKTQELAEYQALALELRRDFEAYADKRSPRVARLALIAGFPDRVGPTPAAPSVEHVLWNQAAGLRRELEAIEAEFRDQIQRRLTALDDRNAAALAEIAVTVEKFRTEMDQRAAREAQSQVAADRRDLPLQLGGRSDLIAESSPAFRVELPEVRPQPGPRRVSSDTSPPNRQSADLDQDLRIWAASQGYSLSPGREGARDATQEFRSWRQAFKDGLSPNSPMPFRAR